VNRKGVVVRVVHQSNRVGRATQHDRAAETRIGSKAAGPRRRPMEEQRRMRLRDKDLAWRTLDKETVVLDLRSSKYLSVNQAGGLLWTCLIEGATQEELVCALVDAFDIEDEVARTDVATFLAACEARDLLEPAS
jgi:hypothetical protein